MSKIKIFARTNELVEWVNSNSVRVEHIVFEHSPDSTTIILVYRELLKKDGKKI